MGHIHDVHDSDARFLIDANTRAIKNQSQKIALMQFDHNSERFAFECPRYVEGHDLSKCNKVEVHYLNVGTNTKKAHSGLYVVDDLSVNAEDESIVIFSWLVSQNATQQNGRLNFLVRFCCVTDDKVDYSWNTDVCKEISISAGIDASGSFETEYVEVIERWKNSVMQHFTDELTQWKATTAADLRKEASDKIAEKFASEKKRIDALAALRKKRTRKIFRRFKFPNDFEGRYMPVGVYWDGENFTSDFNKTDWMYSGGKTYYVSVGGTYLNDGLSREAPVQLYQAITRVEDGDTIIITEGLYSIGDLPLSEYNLAKNVNIIGEGNVVLSPGSRIYEDFTFDERTGLWSAVHPLPIRVVRIDNFDITLSAASSISTCSSVLDSYYHDGTNLYLNTKYNPNGKMLILYETIGFVCNNTSDCKLYMENITIVGGSSNFQTNKNKAYNLEVVLNGCTFMYSLYERAAVRFAGGNALVVDCKAMYSYDDGFGYVAYNADDEEVETNFFEVGCVGANNGLLAKTDNKNGSTAHSGIKGVRVNGLYYNNFGGNVADVQEGTQTVNLGCEAYDSAVSDASQGFGLQQSGATMWLYNCKANGNNADLVAYSGTIAYTHKCHFDYVAGGGIVQEITD